MGTDLCKRFGNDLKETEVVSEFLDRYFYSRLEIQFVYDSFDFGIKDYRRIDELGRQMKSCDVEIYDQDDQIHIIEEKAAVHFINRDLKTFAFELLCRKKNAKSDDLQADYREGWLIREGQETEYYLLCWLQGDLEKFPPDRIHDPSSDDHSLCLEDITGVECYLIKKQTLLDYLYDKDYDIRHLRNLARKMIRCNLEREAQNIQIQKRQKAKDGKGKPIGDFWFFQSKVDDTVINLLIKKERLEELAAEIFFVTPKSCKILKREDNVI